METKTISFELCFVLVFLFALALMIVRIILNKKYPELEKKDNSTDEDDDDDDDILLLLH